MNNHLPFLKLKMYHLLWEGSKEGHGHYIAIGSPIFELIFFSKFESPEYLSKSCEYSQNCSQTLRNNKEIIECHFN